MAKAQLIQLLALIAFSPLLSLRVRTISFSLKFEMMEFDLCLPGRELLRPKDMLLGSFYLQIAPTVFSSQNWINHDRLTNNRLSP